jgi:hypothetical protein
LRTMLRMPIAPIVFDRSFSAAMAMRTFTGLVALPINGSPFPPDMFDIQHFLLLAPIAYARLFAFFFQRYPIGPSMRKLAATNPLSVCQNRSLPPGVARGVPLARAPAPPENEKPREKKDEPPKQGEF